MKRKQPMETTTCPHPPARLYAWYASDPTPTDWARKTLVVACCECGAVLKGGTE